MKKQAGKRMKRIPQRTCVGCREVLPKRTLIRIVRTPEGIRVDPTGKAAGRGAYLHNRRTCWERGFKGALAHALKIDLSDSDREVLHRFVETLPEESSPSDPANIAEQEGAWS
ncbi:MAG: YlxR family protein [Anaerolineae bacterium]|nr:YlxR family protein [Anaerolineae bacterium]